jgi:hypothetical protein
MNETQIIFFLLSVLSIIALIVESKIKKLERKTEDLESKLRRLERKL